MLRLASHQRRAIFLARRQASFLHRPTTVITQMLEHAGQRFSPEGRPRIAQRFNAGTPNRRQAESRRDERIAARSCASVVPDGTRRRRAFVPSVEIETPGFFLSPCRAEGGFSGAGEQGRKNNRLATGPRVSAVHGRGAGPACRGRKWRCICSQSFPASPARLSVQ